MIMSNTHAGAWRTRLLMILLLAIAGGLACCTDTPPPPRGAVATTAALPDDDDDADDEGARHREQPAVGAEDVGGVGELGHGGEAGTRNEVDLDAAAPAAPLTDADFQRHADDLRASIPDEFTIVIQRPFIVLGDESPATVRSRAINTVKWAVDRLKSRYFQCEPDHIITIWLFKDDESYTRNARDIFGERPTTPFGYYSPRHRALVMNISTGGGTLVHEIVHPFISANFPQCPAWFNEGLASLYEQASEREGQIIGLTNWRLAGLQDVIKAGELPSFKSLTHTTTDEFYADGGINYAQARYLCYHLQERGLLKQYYDAFLSNADDDPTGYATLMKVLGVESEEAMAAWQQQWEKFILDLRFAEE
jgi:hypothetical protein